MPFTAKARLMPRAVRPSCYPEWHRLGRLLPVDLINQLHQLGQGVQPRLQRAAELDGQRADPGAAVQPDALPDHGRGPQEVGFLADCERYEASSLIAPAFAPELLHGPNLLAESLAGEGLVVEVG